MEDLASVAESLLKSLGLTSAQATVLSTEAQNRPKFIVYIFDKNFPVEAIKLCTWHGIPVEFSRMKRFKTYSAQLAGAYCREHH